MKEMLKQMIRLTPLNYPLRNWWHRVHRRKELADWEARGRPVPPPHAFKQQVLREYAERYGPRVLVETGTFRGDMVEAMKHVFNRIMGYAVQGSTPCGWWVSCCETPLNGVPGPSGCGYCLQEHSPKPDILHRAQSDTFSRGKAKV
jgi:hypothetical protein